MRVYCFFPVFGLLSSLTAYADEPLFSQVSPESCGIDFDNEWKIPKVWQDVNSYAAMSGVALGDFDGDGWLDICMASQSGAALYRNKGDFTFENYTEKSGVGELLAGRWTTGVSFVDVNNDGHADLFLGGHRLENVLLINNGDGTFVDKSKESGLNFSGATAMAAFADYDRDGDLDCYLLTNKLAAKSGLKADAELVDGKVVLPEEVLEYKNALYDKDGGYHIVDSGQRDYLLQNDGTGVFTDVTKKARLYGDTAPGLSAVWWDSNNDMWPDLYVSSDFYLDDKMWRNIGGRVFKNTHKKSFPHQPWFSMGSDFGDLNGDGHFDYIATDMSPTSHFRSKLTMGDMSASTWFLDSSDPPQYMKNAVYINGGNSRFMEMAHQMKLSSTDWTWSVRAADLDLDGRLDLLFTTGMSKDFENSDLNDELVRRLNEHPEAAHEERSKVAFEFWDTVAPQKDKNHAYRNDGNLHFSKVSEDWGLAAESVSSGLAIGDLDNDGDPDLVMMNFDEAPYIYRNNSTTQRLKVRLVGEDSNKWGVGARLIATHVDGSEDHRMVSLARGFLSSSGAEEIFGLGENDQLASLRVIWPSGKEQTLEDVSAAALLTISEKDAGAGDGKDIVPRSRPFLKEFKKYLPLAHVENKDYDEYLEQPLLPQAVSQYGPGQAMGDLNGDGWEDIVLAGAAGRPSVLLCPTEKAISTIAKSQEALNPAASSEDLAPLLFDADGDGDLDLYVSAGGTEVKEGAAELRDRLYLNSGNGVLNEASQEALPDLRFSSGPVAAADYDQDGDLDLIVGGRTVPGAYPLAPRSALLRNDSANGQVKFTDVTEELAEGLMTAGMVSGALWSDVNGDGWVDLLLAVEWGPVTYFQNEGGKRLVNATEEAGLAGLTGWFTSISAGDVDNDGDCDYVVGNFGRNTKYHPSKDAPALIYYGDFDESGKGQIVEAKVSGDSLLPVRGKSCSQNAMPFIRKKFPTYEKYAMQNLSSIYEDKLDEAQRFEANMLDSGILINDGSGALTFQALPDLAQAAPVFGSGMVDLNADGFLDIVLAQNFWGPQRETGRFDGSQGTVLLGDGTGQFSPQWPDQSGLSLPVDARALAISDLNQDGKPDILVTVNNDGTRAFLNQTDADFLTISLAGKAGNPTAAGARVMVTYANGSKQVLEQSCGGGYLSQSSSQMFVAAKEIDHVSVRWPDGTQSDHIAPTGASLKIQQPSGE